MLAIWHADTCSRPYGLALTISGWAPSIVAHENGPDVGRPWFAGGARVGDTFVQLNDDLRSATVYRSEQSVEGGIITGLPEKRGSM
jgi:hypothetical protein